jgi:hypothetical protein
MMSAFEVCGGGVSDVLLVYISNSAVLEFTLSEDVKRFEYVHVYGKALSHHITPSFTSCWVQMWTAFDATVDFTALPGDR